MTLPPIRANTALFLDFDGTLAPIQEDPDTVFLPEEGEEVLAQLSEFLGGALAIISGRDVRDLAARIPVSLWRAGGHGADICAPGVQPAAVQPDPPSSLLSEAEAVCGKLQGVRLEQKSRVLAFHYRAVPEVEQSLLDAVMQLVSSHADYGIQTGKMVIELRPQGVNKGNGVSKLMEAAAFRGRQPIMVGDDRTDEDAMAVCLEMGGSAVHVGKGESIAPNRLEASADVWNWLKEALR